MAQSNRICCVDGCNRCLVAKGMCDMHYRRMKKTGVTDPLQKPEPCVRGCSINGCDSPVHSRDMCNLHYRRFMRFGDPLECVVGHLMSFVDSLIASEQSDECVIWPFSRDRYGYGQIRVGGKPGRVHRLVLTRLTRKPYHYPLQVRHKCGRGADGCVNPRHLEWGTPADNARDRLRDGTVDFGEDNASSVLSNEQAVAISRDSRKCRVIADEYGIGVSTVSRIRRGESWSAITGVSR